MIQRYRDIEINKQKLIELQETHNQELMMLERDLETRLSNKESILIEKIEKCHLQLADL
jgi:hypothetical protein